MRDTSSATVRIAGEPREIIPGYESGIMLLIIGVLLISVINIRHYSSFFRAIGQDLWKIRSRENAFDNHTLNETRIIISLIMTLCLCEGVVMMFVCRESGMLVNISPFICLLILTGISGFLYIFQLVSYSIVGYTFSNVNYSNQWLRCFNATQCLLGMFMIIPVLTLLFNPEYTFILSCISILFYVIFRIIFIIKGFRIFYHNLFSLIYFILYLCSLEIVPLVLLYNLRGYLYLI